MEEYQKAYLLLTGHPSCHDGDEWHGIFTDILDLKEAYDQLEKRQKEEWELDYPPKIWEFPLNFLVKDAVCDNRVRHLSAEELNIMAEERRFLDDLQKEYQFFIFIEFDEERIREDGYDPEDLWDRIDEILSEIGEIYQPRRGLIVTACFGARTMFMDLIDEEQWFFKYVSKWLYDDGYIREDIMEAYTEAGWICTNETKSDYS